VIAQIPPKDAPPATNWRRSLICCALIVVAVAAVYFPVLQNSFVNYDDPRYITDNPHIQSGLTWNAIRWAATANYESNWHPVTWISHALDISFFGLNPAGHHAVNVLFHVLNALLLFGVLRSVTKRDWESFFIAALFAIHPVNVESVAWASERKNVLSMFFLLIALYAYGRYVQRPTLLRYTAVFFAFALGLAVKPQIITLPFLLLLWDFWPLQRWNPHVGNVDSSFIVSDGSNATWTFSRLIIEKVPLLLLSAASAAITLRAQTQGGAVQVSNAAGHTVAAFSVAVRIENALVAYARYLKLLFWPAGLAPMYPHPGNGISTAMAAISGLLLVALTIAAVYLWRRRYLPTGWFWFLGSMVPMIGLVQVGTQAMADRYAYLPFIGLMFAVVWFISDAAPENVAARKFAAVAGGTVLLIFAVIAHRQVGYWRNPEALWNHTLQVTDRNFVAHDSLAEYFLKQGRLSDACSHFQSAISIFANDMPAEGGLAVCAQARGRNDEAIERYSRVLQLSAALDLRATAYSNLGSIYRERHEYALAKEKFDAALQINPNLPIALVGSGLAAAKGFDYAGAAAKFSHAMAVEPTSVGYLLLENALARSGRTAEAKQAQVNAERLSRNILGDQKIADSLLAQ
jgi:hypothetical protein